MFYSRCLIEKIFYFKNNLTFNRLPCILILTVLCLKIKVRKQLIIKTVMFRFLDAMCTIILAYYFRFLCLL